MESTPLNYFYAPCKWRAGDFLSLQANLLASQNKSWRIFNFQRQKTNQIYLYTIMNDGFVQVAISENFVYGKSSLRSIATVEQAIEILKKDFVWLRNDYFRKGGTSKDVYKLIVLLHEVMIKYDEEQQELLRLLHRAKWLMKGSGDEDEEDGRISDSLLESIEKSANELEDKLENWIGLALANAESRFHRLNSKDSVSKHIQRLLEGVRNKHDAAAKLVEKQRAKATRILTLRQRRLAKRSLLFGAVSLGIALFSLLAAESLSGQGWMSETLSKISLIISILFFVAAVLSWSAPSIIRFLNREIFPTKEFRSKNPLRCDSAVLNRSISPPDLYALQLLSNPDVWTLDCDVSLDDIAEMKEAILVVGGPVANLVAREIEIRQPESVYVRFAHHEGKWSIIRAKDNVALQGARAFIQTFQHGNAKITYMAGIHGVDTVAISELASSEMQRKQESEFILGSCKLLINWSVHTIRHDTG